MIIYLYIKTHNKTGLKYLGKTTSKDPHKYKGSGSYWTSHIKKHGYNVATEIIKECTTVEEVNKWGQYYSELWDIVKSDLWANLKPEIGDGGSFNRSIETKMKISSTMSGRPAHNKGLKQVHKQHKYKTNESSLKGRIRPKLECPHCSRHIDEANYHRYHGDKCKSK